MAEPLNHIKRWDCISKRKTGGWLAGQLSILRFADSTTSQLDGLTEMTNKHDKWISDGLIWKIEGVKINFRIRRGRLDYD